jgi:hypothetical protein
MAVAHTILFTAMRFNLFSRELLLHDFAYPLAVRALACGCEPGHGVLNHGAHVLHGGRAQFLYGSGTVSATDVLVRFNHVASFIPNANDSVCCERAANF